MTEGLDTACRSIVGARSRQEDAAVLWPGATTFSIEGRDWPEPPDGVLLGVLADGMGGHAGGNIASEAACDLFVRAFSALKGDRRARLRRALDASNQGVAEIVKRNPDLQGMGSTLIGCAVSDGDLDWVSVGDSPMYLIRGGEIALLNEDHSLAPALDQLVAEGKLSAEAARQDPRRHMLRSAITGDDLELVDQSQKPLKLLGSDILVIASDGLLTLAPDEIARVALGYASGGATAIADALLREVDNQREPMQDNTTVLVVRVAPS
ncbi:MAG: protein phosphatase 2C domain-containing protein [Pseudomonadota bacterium]